MSWHKERTVVATGEAQMICLRASCRCGKPVREFESRKKITVPDPGQHPLAVTRERARAIQSELADKIWRA
jgi:hypothetical protein